MIALPAEPWLSLVVMLVSFVVEESCALLMVDNPPSFGRLVPSLTSAEIDFEDIAGVLEPVELAAIEILFPRECCVE